MGFTLNRLVGLKWSQLQGSSAKLPMLKGSGKQIQALLQVTLNVFRSMMDELNAQHRDVVRALEHSIGIDDVLAANKHRYALSTDDSASLQGHCWGFAQTITALIKYFHRRDIPLFHYTIKTHLLIHIGLCSSYINPSMASCSEGEDMMKVVKRLMQSSISGCSMEKVCIKAMAKYVRGLSFDMLKPRLMFGH